MRHGHRTAGKEGQGGGDGVVLFATPLRLFPRLSLGTAWIHVVTPAH